jgi:hypothetical protein
LLTRGSAASGANSKIVLFARTEFLKQVCMENVFSNEQVSNLDAEFVVAENLQIFPESLQGLSGEFSSFNEVD